MPENNEDSKLDKKISVVTELVKAVPVYQDAVQPAAQEVGKALGTVTKLVNVALAPVTALVWGYDKIAEYISEKVSEKLKDVPPENIITPPIYIAGPTIEAMRFTADNDELREMYANLLATSMNKETINNTHPRYIDIIKNISVDDAILLKYLSKNWRTCKLEGLLVYDVPINNYVIYYLMDNQTSNRRECLEFSQIKNEILYSVENLIHLGVLRRLENGIHRQQNVEVEELIKLHPFLDTKNEDNNNIKKNDTVTVEYEKIELTSYGIEFLILVVQ